MGQPKTIVWWILWAAMLAGIPQFYLFLGARHTPAPETTLFAASLALIPLLASSAIRWAVLPRMKVAVTALPFFIMGIALSESVSFLGLFLFPAYKGALCLLSGIGIFQFAPYYASKYQ